MYPSGHEHATLWLLIVQWAFSPQPGCSTHQFWQLPSTQALLTGQSSSLRHSAVMAETGRLFGAVIEGTMFWVSEYTYECSKVLTWQAVRGCIADESGRAAAHDGDQGTRIFHFAEGIQTAWPKALAVIITLFRDARQARWTFTILASIHCIIK